MSTFPYPVKDILTLQLSTQPTSGVFAELADVSGQQLFSQKVTKSLTKINMESYP